MSDTTNTRNLMAFEAPLELTEAVKQVATENYTTSSAICRKAIAEYVFQRAENEVFSVETL